MPEYWNPTQPNYMMPPPEAEVRLSEPIIPMNRLGATVAEQQQGGGTFLHNIQSQIRSGTGQIQLIFTVPHTSAIGGRPKGYGKEVRESMREIIKQSGVTVTGAEMPTSSMTNMSGFNPQRNEFSDDVLHGHMQEVRDALKFLVDATGGGGIDIVSMEFPRTIADQRWAKDGDLFEGHKNEMKTGIKQLVDNRTGRIAQSLPLNLKLHVPEYKKDENGHLTAVFDEDGNPKLKLVSFEDKEKYKDEYDKNGVKIKTKEEKIFQDFAEAQIAQNQSVIDQRQGEILRAEYEIDSFKEDLKRTVDEERKQRIQRVIDGRNRLIDGLKLEIANTKKKLEEYKDDLQHIQSAETFGRQKTINSYAELGVHAMIETDANKHKLDRDLWVGPELGWPQAFGGQPDEWVGIIKNARERMVELLSKPEVKDAEGKMVKNEFYKGMSEKEAAKEAAQHIRGVFDTGHMGMWLNHFRRKPGESEEARLKEFNKWYLEQVDKIVKADVVGDIQVVDSQSGAHAHLPPGEGILPLKETLHKFQKGGFKGGFISEGHEEEQYGRGRILTQTWKHFGAVPGGIYGATAPGAAGPIYGTPWGNIQNSYFGRTYTPFFIVGAYNPSNDWKIWSEIPLE